MTEEYGPREFKADYERIVGFIRRERYMAQKALRPGRSRDNKIYECDKAAEALQRLYGFVFPNADSPPMQSDLFATHYQAPFVSGKDAAAGEK